MVVSQGESGEDQRVESVGNVGTESGKQDDEAIEREESAGTKGSGGHNESHDWKDIRDILGGYEDAEDVEKEREVEDIFYSGFALEDMPLMQRQDPELAEIISYLSTGDLPMTDKAARKILMIEDQFMLDDGVLWHFCAPKSRHAKRSLIPLRQLCVPSIPKLDILKSFHEQGTSHKCAEALFETMRQKYFWFNLYSDALLY